MTSPPTPEQLNPLERDQWITFFHGLWPAHQLEVAALKRSFFKPVGVHDDVIYARWMINRDEKLCPLVRFSASRKQAELVCGTLPPASRIDQLQLTAFLD